MNFMFHTMIDAAGVVLRVHYKSLQRDVSYSQVLYVRYLGEVDISFFMHM